MKYRTVEFTKAVTANFTPEYYDKLVCLAIKRDTSVSKLIRNIVQEYLNKEEEGASKDE